MAGEIECFRHNVQDFLYELVILALTQKNELALAVACEKFALTIRLTYPKEVVSVMDAEYAQALLAMSKTLGKNKDVKTQPKKHTKPVGDPLGASLIADALKANPIPDDKQK